MASRARLWMSRHPDSNASVQFNYPPDVSVIGSMSECLELGVVTCNDAGREMLKYMGAMEEGELAPTILMVRTAIDMMDEILAELGDHLISADCPYCGEHMTGARAADKSSKPQKGAFSVCARCGEIAIFQADLSLRKVTDNELQSLQDSPIWPKLSLAIQVIKDRKEDL
jgi:hypothetical protein